MKIGLVLLAGITAVTPLAAQDRDVRERAGVLADDLVKCRAIAEDAGRLACFDRTSAALATARDAGDLVVLDRDGMRKAKRAVFGFSLPNLRLFGSGNDARAEPEVKEIDSTLASVRPAGNGLFFFGLADGSQWQTTETRTGFFPRADKPIRIEAGLLGSYNASVAGKRGIKVKRVR